MIDGDMITDLLDNVQSRDALVHFIYKLQDYHKDCPEEWENLTLDRFLQALASWVDDMDGHFINNDQPIPTSPSWNLIALMLLAASAYE